MRKEQYALIAGGLALAVLLGFMPQSVVNTQEDGQAMSGQAKKDKGGRSSEKSGGGAAAGFHPNDGYKKSAPDIARFQSAFKAAADEKTQKTALDSLAFLYKSVNMPDSAARFAGLYAEKYPSPAGNLIAADNYYEAFSFAMETEKTQELAAKAKHFYGLYLAQNPSDPDAQVKLGVVMVGSEATPMAGVLKIREVLEKNPDNRLALVNLGLLAIRSGQHDKAVKRFERLAELEPDNYEAFFYLGFCFKELGHADKAVDNLKKAKAKTNDPAVQASVDKYLEELAK